VWNTGFVDSKDELVEAYTVEGAQIISAGKERYRGERGSRSRSHRK
jgi:hypothetical protein